MGRELLLYTIPIVLVTEVPCLIFTVFDILKLDCLRKYRIKNTDYPTNLELWTAFKTYCSVLATIMTLATVAFGSLYLFADDWMIPYRMGEFDQSICSFVLELVAVTLFNDLLYWLWHKIAHLPYFYAGHHKHHLLWNTFALGTHVLEIPEIVVFSIPAAIGPILFRSHIYLVWCYAALANLIGTIGHSGYYTPMFQILSIDTRDHFNHHKHPGRNFCTGFLWSFWDRILGTYKY